MSKKQNYLYIGGTSGSVVLDDRLVAVVEPGDVIAPEDAEHERLIKASGHFEPTGKAATRKPTTDPAPAEPPADAEAQETR